MNSNYLKQCMSQIKHIFVLNLARSLPLNHFFFITLLNSLFEMYVFVKLIEVFQNSNYNLSQSKLIKNSLRNEINNFSGSN